MNDEHTNRLLIEIRDAIQAHNDHDIQWKAEAEAENELQKKQMKERVSLNDLMLSALTTALQQIATNMARTNELIVKEFRHICLRMSDHKRELCAALTDLVQKDEPPWPDQGKPQEPDKKKLHCPDCRHWLSGEHDDHTTVTHGFCGLLSWNRTNYHFVCAQFAPKLEFTEGARVAVREKPQEPANDAPITPEELEAIGVRPIGKTMTVDEIMEHAEDEITVVPCPLFARCPHRGPHCHLRGQGYEVCR
jgi:hypothetical protein